MSLSFEPASIYVDLDSLFDMRLVALKRMGLDKVEQAMAQDYLGRFYDEWDGIDTEAYKAVYAQRDVGFLRDALITPVVQLLKDFVEKTLVALVNSPFRRQPKIVLNLHPYVLDEASISVLMLGLRAATKHLMDIEVVSMTLDELTPKYVKQHFVQIVMYQYWEWLEVHAENQNWQETQCPAVRLIGPQLIQSKAAAEMLTGVDVFGAIETHASLFVKLVLYPVAYFSVDLEKFKHVQPQTAP